MPFALVALVRILPVCFAQGALQLSVVIWNFRRVYQVPLLQGSFFGLLLSYFLVLYFVLIHIFLHLCFPDLSKKDEIKTMSGANEI